MAVSLGTSTVVTVFGGSGFVGRYVVQALCRAGCRVKVAVRRPDLALPVQTLGNPGQIALLQANVRDDASVARACAHSDAVVNLVAILAPSGKQKFKSIHAEGAERIAKAARAAGANALVHVSAIGASRSSPSAYARTKADGEMRTLAAFPSAVILRPSIIFGPEDQFYNRFAAMTRLAPVLPLIGGGTRFQPVYVADVAQAIALSLSGHANEGTTYELGGPRVFTFREIYRQILTWTGRSNAVLPVPFWMVKPPAFVLQALPGAPVTLDQLRLLQIDNVVSEAAKQDGRTLEGLGITPTDVETVVPRYLYRFRPKGEFSRPETHAS
jgi:NADH dehydrogenase